MLSNKCLFCGGETKNPKFCNRSCAASYNNRKRIVSAEQKLKTSETLRTGFLLETPEAKKKRIEKMKQAWVKSRGSDWRKKHSRTLSEALKERWGNFIKNTPWEKLPLATQRRLFLGDSDNICNRCGFEYTDPKSQKGPFEIHHKDGDNSNWERANLEVLCLNCHWKTGNYRFRGKKHTEESKRKISHSLCAKKK